MTILSPLTMAFSAFAQDIPRGVIELPEAHAERWLALAKGAHKYVKRVPTGKTTKTGKPRYRYFYDVGHGGGVHSHEHMVEGAAFRHGDGHFHITKVDGDKLHVRHSQTGAEHVTTKRELAGKLEAEHGAALKAYRERAVKALAEAKESGASAKQIARLEERVKASGPAEKENIDVGESPHPEKSQLPSGGTHVTVKHKVSDRDISSGGNGTQRFWKYLAPGAEDFDWPEGHGLDTSGRMPSGMSRREDREASVTATGRLPVGTRIKEINQEFKRGAKHFTTYRHGTIGEWRSPDGTRKTIRWDDDKLLAPATAETEEALKSVLAAKLRDEAKPEPTIGGHKASEARVRRADDSPVPVVNPNHPREGQWLNAVRDLEAKHNRASSRDPSGRSSALSSIFDWAARYANGQTKVPPQSGARLGTKPTGGSSYVEAAIPDARIKPEFFDDAMKMIRKLGKPSDFPTSQEQHIARQAKLDAKDLAASNARKEAIEKLRAEEMATRPKWRDYA